jgi:hypothetical protein
MDWGYDSQKMKPINVLRKYEKRAKENPQLNVATFDEMYLKLKEGIKDRRTLEKISCVYCSYKSKGMDDGFKINSETFKYAIPEFRVCLN